MNDIVKWVSVLSFNALATPALKANAFFSKSSDKPRD